MGGRGALEAVDFGACACACGKRVWHLTDRNQDDE